MIALFFGYQSQIIYQIKTFIGSVAKYHVAFLLTTECILLLMKSSILVNWRQIFSVSQSSMLFSFLKLFYCCSSTVVCTYPHCPPPQPSSPPSPDSTPHLVFIHVSFIGVPENPSPRLVTLDSVTITLKLLLQGEPKEHPPPNGNNSEYFTLNLKMRSN